MTATNPKPKPKAKPPEAERPSVRVWCSTDIGSCLADIRRGLDIKQSEVAARAGVSRQWIVALEQGKPTLELALVLRALDAFGLEIELKPTVPIPPWIARATQDAKFRRQEAEMKRRHRRRTRRERERLHKLNLNMPRVQVFLD